MRGRGIGGKTVTGENKIAPRKTQPSATFCITNPTWPPPTESRFLQRVAANWHGSHPDSTTIVSRYSNCNCNLFHIQSDATNTGTKYSRWI
jgi:hypothetical protein